MIEVTSKIQFTQVCLGNVRSKTGNKMLRTPDGRVMFLPTWWKSIMQYAAKVANKHQKTVDLIEWDAVVDGVTVNYKRYYAPKTFTIHEAFLPGDIIGVNCVLPDEMTIPEFREIFGVAGRYRGICPYKPEKRQGTFELLDVRPRSLNAGSR